MSNALTRTDLTYLSILAQEARQKAVNKAVLATDPMQERVAKDEILALDGLIERIQSSN